MNRQEAIKALLRAGKGEEAAQVIDRAVSAANRAYAAERENRDLSEEAKRRYIAGEYVRHDRELTDQLVRMASSASSTDRNDAQQVFGIAGLTGDTASLTVARRDAADRVANTSSSEELGALLARATRSGDETLARAVAEKALTGQDAKVFQQFLDDRPHLSAAGERLWNAERRGGQTINLTMRLMGLRPDEVGNMSADAARALAES